MRPRNKARAEEQAKGRALAQDVAAMAALLDVMD